VEATFRVTASGVPETWSCGLYRDDSLVVTETLSGQSGYIRDTGLLPAADYTYHITYMKEGRDKDRSDPVAVTTLDTTSHDFTWTVETLGDAGSYLNDVAIVDENNIYVVGEIRSDSGWYNIGIWNNNQWKFDLVGPVGNILYSVFAFSNNDIWVSNACSPYHWDGNEWTYYRFSSNGVGVNACAGKAIWGSSSDNVWFAGNNGSLVHYDGSRFRRVESGTDVTLRQISGTADGQYVFIAGIDYILPSKTTALMINNNQVVKLFYSDELNPVSPDEYGYISAVDVYGPVAYFVTYRGLWKYYYSDNVSFIDMKLMRYNFPKLIIQSPSDMAVIAGAFGFRVFNGIHWTDRKDLSSGTDYYTEQGDYKGNTLVIVGIDKSSMKGLVAIGRRS
jgi:hypothetical protein